ncbi:hypothetical protein [Peristeroidobacter soli]|uniref:hypothetical protein n=1 Tax=Peristeroidobacter soli TaxID=2497877 RepID=UPI00101D2FD5|nr:hypothetical protein [Peristeroidobacter soli]
MAIANAASRVDLVAIVDLKFLESTDQPAAVMCFGDKDEDCVLWATHNLCLELKESESESKTCYDAK